MRIAGGSNRCAVTSLQRNLAAQGSHSFWAQGLQTLSKSGSAPILRLVRGSIFRRRLSYPSSHILVKIART
jgi:hypothetical protein